MHFKIEQWTKHSNFQGGYTVNTWLMGMNKIFIFVIWLPILALCTLFLSSQRTIVPVTMWDEVLEYSVYPWGIPWCLVFSPLIPKGKKKIFGIFLSSSLDKSLVEGKREHPRRSIRLLWEWRTQIFEKGRKWAQSLRATLSRKESKAKHSGTEILGHGSGREPAMHKQLRSLRGVSCCC